MTKKESPKIKKKDSVQKIPLSQVVHVDIDDEVSAIFERVAKKKNDLVYIVVPYRAVLFQSIVNVKILKRKAKDEGKEIAFITKDKSGVFFANKCNIPVFDQAGENKQNITAANIPENILTEADRQKSEFTDLKPSKAPKPRTSIAELIKQVNYQNYVDKVQKFFYKLSRKKSRKQYAQKLIMSNPNRALLVALTLGSVVLLTLIAYVALPNATIYVKPNSVPIERAVNITLADAQRNAGLLRTRPSRTIASYPVEPGNIEVTISFDATGNDITGENARGIITTNNTLNREFPLVPFTRFQANDGMIFRTQGFVVIPAGNPENPGRIDIEVVADPVDVNNVPVGERGNVPAETKFTIPGLTFVNADQLFATNSQPFTGGVTSPDKIVTTRDIEAAREFAIAELRKQVPTKLQEYLIKLNAERNLNLALLQDPQTIFVGEIQTVVDESIVGEKMNTFNVTARAGVTATAYDQSEFVQILRNEVSLRRTPDKALTRIDDSGVTTRILRINGDVGLIELTATIRGVEQFDISDNNEEGQRLIKKIRERVAGLELREARQFIESLPEIESAQITTWPMWAPTIPSRPESIKILIDDRQQ